MVVPGAGEHPLQYNYTFWYSRRTPGRPASTQSYEQNIKQIGSFASVKWIFWPPVLKMITQKDQIYESKSQFVYSQIFDVLFK